MKLKIFLLSLISFFLFPGFIRLSVAYAYISDHSTINQFESLNASQINTAKAKKAIFFHASVGAQIDSGLRCLGGAYPTTPECMPYPAGKYDRSNWSWPAFADGDAPDKLVQFEGTVSSQHNNYGVFGMKFCFIDTYQQSFPNYLAMMLRLPSDKIYIWATQAVTTNWNVEYDPTAAQDFNDALRNYASNHNINLYDLADIESHSSSGAQCTQIINSRTLETICPEWRAGDTSGHLSSLGGIQMAKGFWMLMANINTQSSTPPTATPITVPGDANGDTHVDGVDYMAWLNHYQINTTLGPAVGDFNNDKTVDGVDYMVWFNHYGI